jgi:hypothetical protein
VRSSVPPSPGTPPSITSSHGGDARVGVDRTARYPIRLLGESRHLHPLRGA